MPLPTTNSPWPPPALHPIYDSYTVYDAWYRGDADTLSSIYRGETTVRPPNRPSQYRGGIVGRVARWFWGAPAPAGEQRTKLHIPVASDIAAMSADLLFSEPPQITVTAPAAQARIDELIAGGLHATLLEAAEIGAALGGYYLRAVWDQEISERPWLDAVAPDAAVPEWRWGRLHAVTFWHVVEETPDGTRLLHLERHEPGWILHGLYRGRDGQLGEPIDLTAHPETARLAPTIETRLSRCTAVYVPNMRPNREWRGHPIGAHLGRPDYAGAVLGLMDALDETWSSWLRDIRLGKARLIVPRSYLADRGRGQGATFDLDREVYEEVAALEGEGLQIEAHQFAIRVAEHRETAAELLSAILRATGYSAQSFGLTGDVAMTATEVAARERRSMTTKARKSLYTRPPLADAVEMLLELEAALFRSPVVPERPTIEFGDSISPDIQQLAQTADLLRRAEAASDETIVRLVHPDWDDVQVAEEVRRIADARAVEDPLMLRPDTGGGDRGEDADGGGAAGDPAPIDS